MSRNLSFHPLIPKALITRGPILLMAVILLFLGFGCVTGTGSGKNELDKVAMGQPKLNYAYWAMKEGKYDQVLSHCNDILAVVPDHGESLVLKGYALLLTGKYQAAAENFSLSMKKAPSGQALWGRGHSYLNIGDHAYAQSDADKALSLPNAPDQLARFNRRIGEKSTTPQKAEAEFYYIKAIAYLGSREQDSALEAVDKAISLDPDEKIYHKRKGLIHFARYEYPQASAAFERAARLSPENDPPYNEYNMVGVIAFYQGEYAKAVDYYQKSIQAQSNDAVLSNLGAAQGAMGHLDNAIEHLSQSLAGGDRPDALFHLGYLYHLKGMKALAQSNFEKAQKAQPDIINQRIQRIARIPAMSPTRNFYTNQIEAARQYLATTKSQARPMIPSAQAPSSAPPQKTKAPPLSILKLVVEPDPVPANTQFDIKFLYHVHIADKPRGAKWVSATYYFTISQAGSLLFQSDRMRLDVDNKQDNEWTEHMNPVPRAGKFILDIFLECQGEKATKQIPLTIEP